MKYPKIIAFLAAVFGVGKTAITEAGNGSVTFTPEQVAELEKLAERVEALNGQVSTLTGERDTALGNVTTEKNLVIAANQTISDIRTALEAKEGEDTVVLITDLQTKVTEYGSQIGTMGEKSKGKDKDKTQQPKDGVDDEAHLTDFDREVRAKAEKRGIKFETKTEGK